MNIGTSSTRNYGLRLHLVVMVTETREARYQRIYGFKTDENGKEIWKKEMQKNNALLQIYKGSHILASSGKASSLKSLLDCGTDINEQDENGDTFLHLAIRNKQRNLYEKLVQWPLMQARFLVLGSATVGDP